jgi:hypothetical protein
VTVFLDNGTLRNTPNFQIVTCPLEIEGSPASGVLWGADREEEHEVTPKALERSVGSI